MKKHYRKWLSLILAAAMVFTMNASVFGAPEDAGAGTESVPEEASEEIPPEIVAAYPTELPEYIRDYLSGYDYGQANRENLDVYNTVLGEESGYSDSYKSGFEAGFSDYGYDYYYEGYRDGFYGSDPMYDGNEDYSNGYSDGQAYRSTDIGDDPDGDAEVYENGVKAGKADVQADKIKGNTEKLDEKKKDFKDKEKVSANGYTQAYQAGYFSGYALEGHDEYFNALKAGFEAGRNAAVETDKAVSDFKDSDFYKKLEETNGKEYADTYKKGFEDGVTVGKAERLKMAYKRGFNTATTGNVQTFKNADAYLKSAAYKALTEEGEPYEGYGDAYMAEFSKGFKAAFDLKARTEGYKDGRNAGKTDGDAGYKKVSEFSTEEAVQKYIDEKIGDASYMVRWKTYNRKYEEEDGVAKDGGIIGTVYLDSYKKGYDAAFPVSEKQKKVNAKKDAYNKGFNEGYAIGLIDGKNNNKEAYNADKAEGGKSYYQYVETEKEAHTPEEIAQYKAGYEFGYKAASTTMAYDEGYNDGFRAGETDAINDRYDDDDPARKGFYEGDYPNSAYNVLKSSGSEYGKGYVKGYEEGYQTYINKAKVEDEIDNGSFNYSAAEMDPWRASTDPALWETSQLLINESVTKKPAGVAFKGVYNNAYFDTHAFAGDRATMNFNDQGGNPVGTGAIVATSPFQYYFDLYGKDHLIDKKTVSHNLTLNSFNVYEGGIGINKGSIGDYMYAALPGDEAGKAKKLPDGTEDTGKTYVIVRYKLAGADTNENYKVRRYTFDTNGNEAVVTDHITNYYQGTNKEGQPVLEPVVEYDSRKIDGIKKDKEGNPESNDVSARHIIDAEALVISWTEGQPAKFVGSLDLNLKAKNNVNATVPHNYIRYLGDTDINQVQMPDDNHHLAQNFQQKPFELVQTDKNDPAGFTLSRYYEVKKLNADGANDMKDERAEVAFKGAESAVKLTSAENAFMSKKGDSPSFTLKAKKINPLIKAYSKDIKKALKAGVLTFEISRMKIASDYVSNFDTVQRNTPPPYSAYQLPFSYDATALMGLLPEFPIAPKRSECSSLADYKKKVEEYKIKKQTFDYFKGDKSFQAKAREDFKAAVEAFKAHYNSLVTKYGSNLTYIQKYIEEDWAPANPLGYPGFSSYPYTVTKAARTSAGDVIPVGNTEKYRDLIKEDANCDGIITAIESYEYNALVPGWADGVNDSRFNGTLEAGDNIVLDALERSLLNDTIDYEAVTVGVGDDGKKPMITFTFTSYDGKGDPWDRNLYIKSDGNDSTTYSYKELDAVSRDYAALGVSVYIDFLEEQGTDIDLVITHDPDPVIYPISKQEDTATGDHDYIDIDFLDPVVKASKTGQTMTVKPQLHLEVFGGYMDPGGIVEKERGKSEKKLKVSLIKEGGSPKAGKFDIQLEQKMAESEPFIVATGLNNFEGSIAMRQRQNGDIGFGYFKDDNFYYIYNEEE